MPGAQKSVSRTVFLLTPLLAYPQHLLETTLILRVQTSPHFNLCFHLHSSILPPLSKALWSQWIRLTLLLIPSTENPCLNHTRTVVCSHYHVRRTAAGPQEVLSHETSAYIPQGT